MSKEIGEQVTTNKGYSGTKREAKRLGKEFNWNIISFDAFVRKRGWNSLPGRWKAIIKNIEGEYTEDNILVGTEDDICAAASEITRPCRKCGVIKPGTEFSMDRSPGRPGSTCRKRVCKECIKEDFAKKDKDEIYRKAIAKRETLEGLPPYMYAKMKAASRERGHTDIMPKEEFYEWLKSTPFIALFYDWKHSGFDPSLRPSIDRMVIETGYVPGNIRVVTVGMNFALEAFRKKTVGSAAATKNTSYVKRTNKSTGEVTIYPTGKIAGLSNGGVSATTISRLCHGTTPKAPLMKDYEWMYCDKDGNEWVTLDPTVYKCKLDDNTILATYPNAGKAAKAEGVRYKGINKCLSGKRPNYMGYKWIYKRNYDKT